jgi:hypothetical protein
MAIAFMADSMKLKEAIRRNSKIGRGEGVRSASDRRPNWNLELEIFSWIFPGDMGYKSRQRAESLADPAILPFPS